MLSTTRLHIRELKWDDMDHVHDILSLPETDEFNTLGIPENKEVTKSIFSEWLTAQDQKPRLKYIFAMALKEDQKLFGLIAIQLGKPKYRIAEIWFKIHKDFWGKGFASEALAALLEFGFVQLNLHRIEAGCAVENIASARVLEKAGMTREGRTRKKLPIRGEWKDGYFYGILDEDHATGKHS